ncbi:TetR/AcrR family transcriptional regulator [Ilumatobacter coccineus]|uniref:Putative TetR family transcriptional regulator n=1 Tax=Ilumatobacter coccineus (strain NBRC 103263 / KCTC 29153 / YM16-304) TaxID=1313172 RepID=A0A6C7E3P1_ILUCY|nr:TetR/AcrR family transcriptional regulator [Ilumatobacter coccineus]BAN01597.1 putative TetR family transcriptional regulator [Ilumatobacter coccineus YM16-304]
MMTHDVREPTTERPSRGQTCAGVEESSCSCEGDGRIRRRLRNRKAILDALGSLLQRGVASPSLEEVADEAGVSTRSVYRHFGTVEEAREEWAVETERYVAGLVSNASGRVLDGASLEERCLSLVMARLALYDQVGGLVRATSARRAFSERDAKSYEFGRAVVEAQVPERFAPELDAMEPDERVVRLAMVNTLVSDLAIDDLMTRFGERRQQLVPLLVKQLVTAFTC